jgi:hypothetical protein
MKITHAGEALDNSRDSRRDTEVNTQAAQRCVQPSRALARNHLVRITRQSEKHRVDPAPAFVWRWRSALRDGTDTYDGFRDGEKVRGLQREHRSLRSTSPASRSSGGPLVLEVQACDNITRGAWSFVRVTTALNVAI